MTSSTQDKGGKKGGRGKRLPVPFNAFGLIGDASRRLINVLKKELEVARVEIREKLTGLAIGLALVIGGTLFMLSSVMLLLQSAIAALVGMGLSSFVATLMVSGVVFAMGGLILWFGIIQLNPQRLTLSKTLAQLQADATALRDHVAPK
jgi:Putative Actinobacterial Holin-X, holin superfamily III